MKLMCPAISSSFEMILDTGVADTNRICLLDSWNNPDISRLSEDAMMSIVFGRARLTWGEVAISVILINYKGSKYLELRLEGENGEKLLFSASIRFYY
jgi:hypothetical protein